KLGWAGDPAEAVDTSFSGGIRTDRLSPINPQTVATISPRWRGCEKNTQGEDDASRGTWTDPGGDSAAGARWRRRGAALLFAQGHARPRRSPVQRGRPDPRGEEAAGQGPVAGALR